MSEALTVFPACDLSESYPDQVRFVLLSEEPFLA